MNKLMLICLLLISMSSFSQQEMKDFKIIGREWQQDYVNTMRGFVEENKQIPYNENTKASLDTIIFYYNNETNIKKKQFFLQFIKLYSQESIDFLEDIVQNESSEELRISAINSLAFIGSTESIPFLLGRTEDDNVSDYEKVIIASGLILLQDTVNGETLLNNYCYSNDSMLCYKCIWSYYMLGNTSAINYYRYLINNSKDYINVNIAVQKLAELGDIETAYPVMEKIMNEENSIKGGIMRILKAMGDDKSIQLIKKTLNDKNEANKDYAKKILKNIK
ncbi:MAG: HEAT repeat domain-containing protein [Bacteroidales bacterium]|nr:HEAT repeat domain-containing protein [Bacteroidales bacterium]MDD4002368.1 HEAT repeat domain-containing protein [Bacteroidales bacterium]